jgi:hypothetical protein
MGRFSPTVQADYGPGLDIAGALDAYQSEKQRRHGEKQQKLADALQAMQVSKAGIHEGQAPTAPPPVQFSAKPGTFDPTLGTFAPATITAGQNSITSPLTPRPGVSQLTPDYYLDRNEANANRATEHQTSMAELLDKLQLESGVRGTATKDNEQFRYDLGASDRAAKQRAQQDKELAQTVRDAERERHNRATEHTASVRASHPSAGHAMPATSRRYFAEGILAQYGGDAAKALASPEAQDHGLGMADFAGVQARAGEQRGKAIFGQAGRMLSSFADTSASHAIGQAGSLYDSTHTHAPVLVPSPNPTGHPDVKTEQRKDWDAAAASLRAQGKDPVTVLGTRP